MRTKSFGKIVMALVFASMIGGISIVPAFGKDNDGHKRYGEHGRYEHGRYEHGRRVYQAPPRYYYYSEPVYAPPPVVYVPAPSPGISLVFPIHIR
jgi:hypothetical protein